jgi:SSS family solute:Na+ symporter
LSSTALAVALVAFVVLMFGIGFRARARIHTVEDYLVAGRRLTWPLASATLFATWFGAGTLLTATDEARAEGLRASALEPIGPGLCLVLAGAFFAARLWRMKLLTLPDFYRRRFGPRAEVVASIIMVPGYFGWIAAQFVALAGILEVFWQIPMQHGIWLVALVGTGYTLLGGMWSVTLTDVVQLALVLIGLVVLAVTVLAELGGGAGMAAGWARLVAETPPEHLVLMPAENAAELVGWLSVLAVGALGNIPGQDLAQRIFASRSERVATTACCLSGVLYIVLGMIPVTTGLAADTLGIDGTLSTLPALAAALMTPVAAVVFVLAIVSAVMSTIDSAILAPSSVLSHNLLAKVWPNVNGLALGRVAIVAVAGASIAMSYAGAGAYELLETAYAIGMVALFVPLALGLTRRGGEAAALTAMITGTVLWGSHLALGWESFGGPELGLDVVPQELAATFAAWVAYEAVARRTRPVRLSPPSAPPVPAAPRG